MKQRILSLALAFTAIFQLRADEGMWPLTLLQKIQDPMQARGLKLSADDIYAVNHASVKDAIVRLMSKQGRMFCTGEVISSQGLFLTNHHCGYGAIQELSTNEDNILKNGFWAANQQAERKANFNIGLLRKIEDVTAIVLKDIAINQDEATRAKAVMAQIAKAKEAAIAGLGEERNNYVVEISSFYNGNQYLAMYYEVYRDIRLVGTPPESVGKFGGETDNWRWPRHTCDFSMFRIYANENNKPADFTPANRPFNPQYHLAINIGGMKTGDYAMIMGYPGRTARYTYSEGIKYLGSKERPMRVALRRDIMDVYEKYMKQDESVRLMYSDRLAGIGNYWNKFNGEAHDLSKPGGLYDTRKAAELSFERWMRENKKTDVYGDVTSLYDEAYRELYTYGLYPVYFQDGISNSQPMSFAMSIKAIADALSNGKPDTAMSNGMLRNLDEMYKEFYPTIEKEVLAAVLDHLYKDLDPTLLPADLVSLMKKYKDNASAVAEVLFAKSILSDKGRMAKFLAKPSAKKLESDQLYKISIAYINKLRVDLKPVYDGINSKLDRANRLFLSAQLEMSSANQGATITDLGNSTTEFQPPLPMAPDANGTMRLTYGTIMPYDARDAVSYSHFTTSKGILEKYKLADFEFDAPQKLLALIRAKDFGQYADKDGELHTCFLSNNDITGGNSGSPVMNAKGQLIGTAFDGNWEAISSDFAFLPNVQRTISLDVRYTLFIVEKLGGAKHLIDEMTIVRD
jgi:hypothetical protein